jgi:hypothetical protein
MYSSLDADARFAHPAPFVEPLPCLVHGAALLQITRPSAGNRVTDAIEPMTLGNMRELGVRSLCRIVGGDARPNWKEQPPRETLTGVQWRS